MAPVFQFTFFTDDGPDVYVVTGAYTSLEAHIALVDARKFELTNPEPDLEIKELTTNSVIRVVESDQE